MPSLPGKTASARGLHWFQDARFAMFVHWGIYSLLERGEWVMHMENIPVAEYEQLAMRFNPVRFNADAWVALAADAGQKSIVITSRHHDGFSMFDTSLSDYKITQTPFKRDPLMELANACAKRGDVKLGFYQSLLDWHHPAYRFRAQSGLAWDDYIGFLHGQVRELCTNYGQVCEIWFDGDWPHASLDSNNAHFAAGGSWRYPELYDMIHTLQPDAVVHNNRHATPISGEDVQGFEQDLPGENSAGFNVTGASDMPTEVCMTINNSWGYHSGDHDHKSTATLIHKLVKSAALGANYLLNVGPTPLGEIQPLHAQRLRDVGEWLRVNGDAVYGTRAGDFASGRIPSMPSNDPFVPTGEAVSTRRGDTHYVHVLGHTSDSVSLKAQHADLDVSKLRATALRDGSAVRMQPRADGWLTLTLPVEQRDPLNTVVVLN
jgi:alpha-L-fucosidase